MNPRGIKPEPSPMGMAQVAAGPTGNRDPRPQLPTLIYDYFLKTRQPDLARQMLDSNLDISRKERPKPSPSGRDVNGINDGMPKDDISEKIEKLPVADFAEHLPNESFLQDWFNMFWDLWAASRNGQTNKATEQYWQTANRLKNQNMMLNSRMAAAGAGRIMNNGMNSMQGQAMMNNLQRRNPMMPQNQMGQAGADGQRPQSPMSGDNQPSPKRQRLGENYSNPAMSAGAQSGAPGQPPNLPAGMDPAQFGLMNSMGMMDEQSRMNNPQGGALADYQMQLMLLEQQNKRRLLMARQEQDVAAGASGPPGATPQPTMMNQQGMPFNMPPGMSPRRNGQSPSPNDPMKRNPSQIGQSPRPDGMQVSRGSPAPAMFDPTQAQQAAMGQAQFLPPGMRPNGMGPGGPQGGFQQGPNGQVRPMGMQGPRPGQPPFPPGMPFAQNAQPQPPNANNPQATPQGNQPAGSMLPPQAPAAQPGRTNPSSPALGQAPATPRQTKETVPKKKDTGKKDAAKNKQQAKKPVATPNTEAEAQHPTPTPSTPVDPHPPPSVLSKTQPNGTQQPSAGPNGMQAQAGSQPDAMAGMEQAQMTGMGGVGDSNGDNNIGDFNFEFGPTTDVLDGFDFDSFLQVDGDASNYDFTGGNFDMGAGLGTELADNPH